MSTKRTRVDQFPCPRALALDFCRADCHLLGPCEYRQIYEQAIADHKCARLLRVFEKRYWDPVMARVRIRLDHWYYARTLKPLIGRLAKLRTAIRDALHAAGLE